MPLAPSSQCLTATKLRAWPSHPATDHIYVKDTKERQAETAEYESSGNLRDVFGRGAGSLNFGLAVDGASGRVYETSWFGVDRSRCSVPAQSFRL